MDIKCFRNHTICRTCTKSYRDYKSYKEYLANDFSHRCAYCNLKDSSVTSFFEIDHFVPKSIVEAKPCYKYLITDYNNLMYTCRNCNNAKSDQYEGDINNDPYENRLFYNPVTTDMNKIFFRDEYGGINSEDVLGNEMINRLNLYLPIHNLAWICELLDDLTNRLDAAIEKETTNEERKSLLISASHKAHQYYKLCNNVFIANYNNKQYTSLHIPMHS